jgi:hypothetical protein
VLGARGFLRIDGREMKGWLLLETLLVLLVANAITWFVVAMGWP